MILISSWTLEEKRTRRHLFTLRFTNFKVSRRTPEKLKLLTSDEGEANKRANATQRCRGFFFAEKMKKEADDENSAE